MGVIFITNHMIWQRQQCVHILSLIMHFHTGNVYWGIVLNVHISFFLTKKETTPSIRFHIYPIIGHFTAHGIIPLKDKKICYMYKQESSSDKYTKIYTRKELDMMETTISDFHAIFYIPSIQKLDFHLPHVRILGTNNCGEMKRTAFKRRELFQDFLFRRDYA